jgi:hypothetical protein
VRPDGVEDRKRFFYLDSTQPFEKSQIGQSNPRKSKLFFLELFGFAWIYLVLGAALTAGEARGDGSFDGHATLTFADLCRFLANVAYYR